MIWSMNEGNQITDSKKTMIRELNTDLKHFTWMFVEYDFTNIKPEPNPLVIFSLTVRKY